MNDAALSLVSNHRIVRQIAIHKMGRHAAVFSFERCRGALVGTHAVIGIGRGRLLEAALPVLADEWERADPGCHCLLAHAAPQPVAWAAHG